MRFELIVILGSCILLRSTALIYLVVYPIASAQPKAFSVFASPLTGQKKATEVIQRLSKKIRYAHYITTVLVKLKRFEVIDIYRS